MKDFWQSIRALMRLKPSQRLTRDYLLSLLTAVLLALLVGAGIMLLCGHDPAQGYAALIKGALGKPRAVGNTLAKTVTLCLTGLAMSLAAKAGMFNVGGEGQLLLGAIFACQVGIWMDGMSPWLVIPAAALASMAASSSRLPGPPAPRESVSKQRIRAAQAGSISRGTARSTATLGGCAAVSSCAMVRV